MNFYDGITQMIGHKPLLRLGRIGPDWQIFAKREFSTPVSLKDRSVLQIIEDAEADDGKSGEDAGHQKAVADSSVEPFYIGEPIVKMHGVVVS